MKKYLIITADSNDADYNTSKTEVTDEQMAEFTPLIEAIKKFKPYNTKIKGHDYPMDWIHNNNWPKGEYGCREDLREKTTTELYKDVVPEEVIEEFDDMVPTGEEGNVHTIKRIELIEVANETRLL